LLDQLQGDPGLAISLRTEMELSYAFKAGLERAPIRSRKSSTRISRLASDLIIACEVTSQTVYESRYEAPVWPQGESGITIGIGYDVGYVTPADLSEDWGEYVGDGVVELLSDACGVTGTGAGALLDRFKTVRVSWYVAQSQYVDQIRPRYVGATEYALPNTSDLSSDCLGALVSLVYNRGASFDLSGPRYEEMRKIKALMASKHFRDIPAEIRRMKRLWTSEPNRRGLLLRRDAEAALFELGLSS